jgi:hypothetical protein
MRVFGLIGKCSPVGPFFIALPLCARSAGTPLEIEFSVLNPNLMAPRRSALILG